MGKKNKPKKHVLKAGDKIPADRLATTVRADDATLILGGTTLKADAARSLGKRFATGVSRVAQRMVPLRMRQAPPVAAGIIQDKKANKKIRKLAKQIAQGRPTGPKPRRSRLPLVIVSLLALTVSGGYWAYHAIPWPDASGVASVLDYNRWFDAVSGRKKPQAQTATVAGKSAGKQVRQSASGSKPRVSVSRNAGTRKVVSSKKTKAKKTVRKSTARKSTKVASRKGKKKAWKQRMARLKKQGQAKYRKAAHKYRNKGGK